MLFFVLPSLEPEVKPPTEQPFLVYLKEEGQLS
jgi:hypothetical protein